MTTIQQVKNSGQFLGLKNSLEVGTYDYDSAKVQIMAIRTARLLYGRTNTDMRNDCNCLQCRHIAIKNT